MQEYNENEYCLYSPKIGLPSRTKFLSANKGHKIVQAEGLAKFFKSFWRTMLLEKKIRSAGLDVYHGLSNEIPRRKDLNTKTKFVVTIHDLLFLRFPNLYPRIDRKIYERKFRYACENADLIIAISKCTKNDIVKFFGTDPKKIKVVYQSCHTDLTKEKSETELSKIRKKHHLPKKFMLNVGTIEERKNLKTLIKALLKTKSDLPLVIIGKMNISYFSDVNEIIEREGLPDRVIFPLEVSMQDLIGIYQLADLFIYPSHYEGFGIPVLEAMYSKTPVITTKGTSMEEIAEEWALYTDPNDSSELASKIDQILMDETLQRKLRDGAFQRAKQFSAKKHASEIMKIYESLGQRDLK